MASGLPDFRSPVDIAASALLEASVTIVDQVGNVNVSIAEALAQLDVNLAAQANNIAVQIADQVGNLAIDVVAQTLAALNTDYRYGTATESAASADLDSDENIILTIEGKGIIKGGFFELDSESPGDLPDVLHKIIFRLDGEDHDFDYIETLVGRQFGAPPNYVPAITRISNDKGLISGIMPGPITFEESFSLVIDSTGAGKTNTIDAVIFFALSL
jgi:hypothetical protein